MEEKSLSNAVTACCERGSASQARLLYKKAEDAYYDFVQVRNRLRYLVGMLIGVLAAANFSAQLLLQHTLGGEQKWLRDISSHTDPLSIGRPPAALEWFWANDPPTCHA